MHDLLNEYGILTGLLFNRTFEKTGPPYGGNSAEYHELFSQNFQINHLDPAKNSIPQRQGNELFIEFVKN